MTHIRILPDRVANQIAAGEVVERPASVVKELVENSLDAGATRIEVEFRSGGRALIRVGDNGHGMGRDDALLCLERHATSKITEAADLDHVRSFGFRGEALPSIASVSRFELKTRRAQDESGTEVAVNGGRVLHVRDCGTPPGTCITVTGLFGPVPARRKFLKADATEAAHIIQCVRCCALACPETAFTLIEDGRPLFQSPPAASLRERAGAIFGRVLAAGLRGIDATEGGLRIHGLIGGPDATRATRHDMHCFVNRRPVESRTLSYAILESMQGVLPKGRYPVAFLFLEIDPAQVDVNVHPAKREIRFRNEGHVRGVVIRALLQAIGRPVPGMAGGERDIRDQKDQRDPKGTDAPAAIGGPAQQPPDIRDQRDIRDQKDTNVPAAASAPVVSGLLSRGPVPSSPPSAVPEGALRGWRCMGLLHGTWALFETPAGLLALDRRAAHERIWFERLQDAFDRGGAACQRLLIPVPLELDPVGSALLVDRLPLLKRHGFDVAEFGRNFFRIEGAPAWLEPGAVETFVRDLIGLMREGSIDTRHPDLARDALARLASSRAVRPSDATSPEALMRLAGTLLACRQPLVSPSGRATMVEWPLSGLERRFAGGKDSC